MPRTAHARAVSVNAESWRPAASRSHSLLRRASRIRAGSIVERPAEENMAEFIFGGDADDDAVTVHRLAGVVLASILYSR